ncbi:hypothetical protein [Cysteiniphilum halobium]|uniref:hypothetical protein n=1 Tax=Cysteiniphilum halobium TaxID=2219059 RepID=UPI003F82C455
MSTQRLCQGQLLPAIQSPKGIKNFFGTERKMIYKRYKSMIATLNLRLIITKYVLEAYLMFDAIEYLAIIAMDCRY